mgnify:CR=1 FL=1
MINESSVIQLASPPETFLALATMALQAAASEFGLSAYPSWPRPVNTLDSQLLDVQNLVQGSVRTTVLAPSRDLCRFAKALGFSHRLNSSEWGFIRETIRLALFDLSYNATLLLPAHEDYCIEGHPLYEAARVRPVVSHAHEVLRNTPNLPQRSSRRIASLVSATEWREICDVSIDELACVNQALVANAPELATKGSALAVNRPGIRGGCLV